MFRSHCCLLILVTPFTSVNLADASELDADRPEIGFVALFDGQSKKGWDGDWSIFRIDRDQIVGGQLESNIPHNYFLVHEGNFGDFDLRLQFRLLGVATNSGVQIRSQRIPNHHEMIGYQADLGQTYWGCLYDESRRNRVLASPVASELDKVLKREEWNDYRILCEGRRIRLWVNGLKTVDFTEPDVSIPLRGKIGLQIHGGPPGETRFRRVRIKPLN